MSTDNMVQCTCGKRLRLPRPIKGALFRCPACGNEFSFDRDLRFHHLEKIIRECGEESTEGGAGEVLKLSRDQEKWIRLGADIIEEIERRFAGKPGLLRQFLKFSEKQRFVENQFAFIVNDAARADAALAVSFFARTFASAVTSDKLGLDENPQDIPRFGPIGIAFLKIACALDPHFFEAWFRMACYHQLLGNIREARNCLVNCDSALADLRALRPENRSRLQQATVEFEASPALRKYVAENFPAVDSLRDGTGLADARRDLEAVLDRMEELKIAKPDLFKAQFPASCEA